MIFQKQGFFPRDDLFLSLSRGTETSYVPDAVQNILLLFFKIVIYVEVNKTKRQNSPTFKNSQNFVR